MRTFAVFLPLLVAEFAEAFLENTLPLYLFKDLNEQEKPSPTTTTTTTIATVRRVPPYFSYPLDRQYTVGIGGSINLTCVAVGYPMPRVFWKKTDQELLDDPNSAPIGKNVLTLTNVESTENFTCVAVSALGNIEATTTVIAKELPPPPDDILASSITSNSIVLTWTPPNTKETINKYVVRYKPKYSDSRRGKTLDTIETSIEITNLTAFQTYEITVRSVGPVGPGVESLPIEAQTQAGKPTSGPVNPQARCLGRDSVLVKWGPCDHPNGVITGYMVYYTNEKESTPLKKWQMKEAKSDELMTTIYGLEADTRYYIRIVARNAIGDSPLSPLVTVSTRQGTPGQPTELHAKPLDSRRIQLSWEKPLFSSPVSGYTIRYNTSDGEKELTLTVPHEKHVVTGLQPDRYYYFRVAAYSDRGQGEFSEALIAKTIASIPLASPKITKCIATSSKSVEVHWTNPEKTYLNGNLTSFRVSYRILKERRKSIQYSDSEDYEEEDGDVDDAEYSVVVVSGNESSLILNQLLPYTTYEVTVAAATEHGYGPNSESSVVKTHEDVPSAPRNFNVELTTATSVKLTWEAPASPNGNLFGYYIYFDKMLNGEPVVEKNNKKRIVMIKDSTKRYYEMDNLDPNTEYSFRLNAFNRNGDGEFSERKNIITQGIAPEPPEIVSVVLEREDAPVVVKVEWKTPRMRPNESPIEKYNVWLKPQGYHDSYSKRKTVAGTDSSATISGLWMGVTYDVLLGAENREGMSKNASESIATPVGTPDGEPINVQYEILKGEIVVSWRPPPEEQRNGNISMYKAVLTPMDESNDRYEKTVTAPETTVKYKVNVRRPYLFKVAAATMKGLGPFSPVLNINPDPAG
ncbi:unnamed protein product [Caenorhabditis bovis]|uniref:protein-tyrosine-phosphatase n=1 Tax=Caenorhabditis bovis TaxID=2654633 RepID=A0A8S1EQ88_9PELO|nr:unnamed protein product [Caenorhabditis bovis]